MCLSHQTLKIQLKMNSKLFWKRELAIRCLKYVLILLQEFLQEEKQHLVNSCRVLS